MLSGMRDGLVVGLFSSGVWAYQCLVATSCSFWILSLTQSNVARSERCFFWTVSKNRNTSAILHWRSTGEDEDDMSSKPSKPPQPHRHHINRECTKRSGDKRTYPRGSTIRGTPHHTSSSHHPANSRDAAWAAQAAVYLPNQAIAAQTPQSRPSVWPSLQPRLHLESAAPS